VRLYRDHRLRVSLQRLLGLQGQALHPVPYIRSIFIEEPLSRSKGTGRAASATRPTTAPVTTVAESANRCSSTIRSPTMTSHQFHVAQTVYIRSSAFTRNAAAGLYEIRAVLPEENGRRRYRIKSLIEPYECVASEHELSEA
jgi:hypothetical protein